MASKSYNWATASGEQLTTNTKCRVELRLPELSPKTSIFWNAHVIPSLGQYDLIIGRDLLRDLAIDLNFSTSTISWNGNTMPMKTAINRDLMYVPDPERLEESHDDVNDRKAPPPVHDVVASLTHLSEDERFRLMDLLLDFEPLFNRPLGKFNIPPVNIKLREGAKPFHSRAYPIPHSRLPQTKAAIQRMCDLGILTKINKSEWAAPSFGVPKKNGDIRIVSDFRQLNKWIVRCPYPMPRIQQLFQELIGFQFSTSLDLNMGFFHIPLTPEASKLCAIVLPFGKFQYQRLPMGLCNSPDIFQESMSRLLDGLDSVRVYMDDILVITRGDFSQHLDDLRKVFIRLKDAGLSVNMKKSAFAQQQLDYLGYHITRTGIRPQSSKVQAILNLDTPKTKKQLRRFIGMVNFYRDMWIRRSHLLAPLAKLTSKSGKWSWTSEHQECFDTMKRVISKQVLLSYPDFNAPFVIYTDASKTQLGGVITQDNKPLAFYSRKLNPAQTRYTTTERELLSIVETLKEYRTILLGHKIIVYTDHQNLTFNNFTCERVLRWRLLVEEFGPELRYIKGPKNVVADALSRLDLIKHPPDTSASVPQAELFADLPNVDYPEHFPLSYKQLADAQQLDARLQRLKHNKNYAEKTFRSSSGERTLICYKDKIVIPASLQEKAVTWYHEILMHPGETRTEATMRQHFHFAGMTPMIARILRSCQACQLNKKAFQKLGTLPPKDAEIHPWETLCIDLIGPYTIRSKSHKDKTKSLHALTMIDPATSWFEIAPIPDKRADVIANILEQTWFNRYPWPRKVISDRGTEFMAEVTDMLKNDYGCTHQLITTRNPQANAILERAHQKIHTCIATSGLTYENFDDNLPGILSAVGFAIRSTIHTTLDATPAQLVFGRDSIHQVEFRADWNYIKARKQRRIDQNNAKENQKRTPHAYRVGDRVRIRQNPNTKFGQPQFLGPYTIVQVFGNGTVRLSRDTPNGGAVEQTWNIRNILPYAA